MREISWTDIQSAIDEYVAYSESETENNANYKED